VFLGADLSAGKPPGEQIEWVRPPPPAGTGEEGEDGGQGSGEEEETIATYRGRDPVAAMILRPTLRRS
jgi:hypothetical protein